MLVYRFENARGFGPYCGELQNALLSAHESKRTHPGYRIDFPRTVGVAVENAHVRFAFPTHEHARRWFRGWMRRLRRAGYVLHVYIVPERYVFQSMSGRQAAFDPLYAVRLTSAPDCASPL